MIVGILMVIFLGIALITYVDNTTKSRRQSSVLPEAQKNPALSGVESASPVANDSAALQILRLPEPQRQQAWALLCLLTDALASGEYQNDARTHYLLQQTHSSYLPDTLRAYLNLTPGARQHLAAQGQDPQTLLAEQLALMEDGVRTAMQHDHAAADRLLTQGRFLRERFGEAEGLILMPAGKKSAG